MCMFLTRITINYPLIIINVQLDGNYMLNIIEQLLIN